MKKENHWKTERSGKKLKDKESESAEARKITNASVASKWFPTKFKKGLKKGMIKNMYTHDGKNLQNTNHQKIKNIAR